MPTLEAIWGLSVSKAKTVAGMVLKSIPRLGSPVVSHEHSTSNFGKQRLTLLAPWPEATLSDAQNPPNSLETFSAA